MKIWQLVLYRKKGKSLGISPEIIENAIKIYTRLANNNVAGVLTLKHLSQMVNLPYLEVKKFTYNQKSNYYIFKIRKRSGGKRNIYAPSQNLLTVQKWISDNILQRDKNISNYCFAFRRGQSIKNCAEIHCNARWLIRIDIENYFESISEIDVYNYFHKLGYTKLLSFQLARICTVYDDSQKMKQPYWSVNKNHKYSIFPQKSIGFLPQGAASSPMLANLITYDLDNNILKYLEHYNNDFSYSRYADDIFISTDNTNYDMYKIKRIFNDINNLIYEYGFSPNKKKGRIIPPGKRKNILGLNINSSEVKLTKQFRNKLECHLYYFSKNKITHCGKRKFNTIFGEMSYLHGLVSYAKQIDEPYITKLMDKLGIDESIFKQI